MSSASLDFVTPLSVTFPLDDSTITITPITVGEMPAALRAAEPMFAELTALDLATTERLAARQFEPADMALFVRLAATHGPRLIDTVAVCSRQPAQWVGALLFDRFVQLAAVCFQVNRDFFVRAMPGLQRTFEALASPNQQAASPSTGPTPSSS